MVEHLLLETQEFSSGDIFISLLFFHFLHSLLVLFLRALGTLLHVEDLWGHSPAVVTYKNVQIFAIPGPTSHLSSSMM